MAKLTEEEIRAIRERNDEAYLSRPNRGVYRTRRLSVETLRSMVRQVVTGNYEHMLGPVEFSEHSLFGYIREEVLREQREQLRMKITEGQLRRIIREELKREYGGINEGFLDSLKSIGKKSGSGLPSIFAKVSDMYGQLEDQIQEYLDSGLANVVTKAVEKIQTMPGDEDPSSLLGVAKVFTTGTTEDLSVASRDLRGVTEDLLSLKKKLNLSKSAFRQASEVAEEKPEEAKKIIKKAFQQYGGGESSK